MNGYSGGNFVDAEKILEKAANEFDRYNAKSPVEISNRNQVYSDFENNKRASVFLNDNTSCQRMPLPVIMNIANLIHLNPADYEAFVKCRHDKEEPKSSDYVEPYDIKLESKQDAEKYLASFKNFLAANKQARKNLDQITTSSEMKTTLGNMCSITYSALTAAERKQILKVLTGGEQLITVLKTIQDAKQVREIADYLNTNQAILLKLIKDGSNHDEMMKALFDMCSKKDDHNSFTADDLLGNRLYYKAKFDYGAFAITATMDQVNFGSAQNGAEPSFYISVIRKQVFEPNIPSEVISKYRVQLDNNGYSWISNIKPLDAVTVVFVAMWCSAKAILYEYQPCIYGNCATRMLNKQQSY